MPSGYTTGTRGALLIDVAVLWFDKQGGDGNPTKYGLTVGGVTYEPETEWRQPEFDGRRSAIEGMDRKVFQGGVFTGEVLAELPKHIPLIEPGATSAAGSAPETTVWTPKAASTFLSADTDYLQNVRMVWTKANGTLVGVRMERALGTFTQIAGDDKNEGKISFRIEARLEDGAAATSTDTAPIKWVEMSAIS